MQKSQNADNVKQGTVWTETRVHAMSGDKTGYGDYQSRAEAYIATGAWVTQNYMLAIIDKMVWGDVENFYKEMGFALHAVQDQWCPSHEFKNWDGGEVNMVKYHWKDLLKINSDKALESSKNLLNGNIGAAMRHF